jgi:uncharacterized protein (TIGR02246 family)
MITRLLVPLLALAMIAACASPPHADARAAGALPITSSDRDAIMATAARFQRAFKAGEEEKLGPLYTRDAILYGPDEPPVTGREAIVKSFSAFPPLEEFTVEVLEIEGYGDLAYLRGTAVLTMTGPDGNRVVLSGKYIEIHRKQADGSWLIARDVFNFDSPSR